MPDVFTVFLNKDDDDDNDSARNGASERVGEGVGMKGRQHWRVNLADQNKQQPQEDACHVPYMTSQYETNL